MINGTCSVLKIEEYESLRNKGKREYFQRLTWIPGRNKFEDWDS